MIRVVVKERRAAYADSDALAAQVGARVLAKCIERRTRRGEQPTRRAGLDPTMAARCVFHSGAHAATDQRHRVDDQDLPRPLSQREALGRHSNSTLDGNTSRLGDQFRNEQRLIDGDSKSFAISISELKAGRRRRVNGNYLSAGVDERASGVTSLDRCVNLN